MSIELLGFWLLRGNNPIQRKTLTTGRPHHNIGNREGFYFHFPHIPRIFYLDYCFLYSVACSLPNSAKVAKQLTVPSTPQLIPYTPKL